MLTGLLLFYFAAVILLLFAGIKVFSRINSRALNFAIVFLIMSGILFTARGHFYIPVISLITEDLGAQDPYGTLIGLVIMSYPKTLSLVFLLLAFNFFSKHHYRLRQQRLNSHL